jgi:hypothetical protein
MDLFASPARPPERNNPKRQKAVALLRALLIEAVTKPTDVPLSNAKTEAGNE